MAGAYMRWIKATDGVVIKYPYSLSDLRGANPDTIFPPHPSEEVLAGYDVFVVEQSVAPAFNPDTQTLRRGVPQLDDGVWRTVWEIAAIPEEELALQQRKARNDLLASTDYIVIAAIEKGEAVPESVLIYRQELRDISAQPGFPASVSWPIQGD